MKRNHFIPTAGFIFSLLFFLSGSAFCEPKPLDDVEMSEIHAQASSVFAQAAVNKDGEVSESSSANTASSNMDQGQASPAGFHQSSPFNDMHESLNMNQFSNTGSGASCH